jgi:uncharacterized protein
MVARVDTKAPTASEVISCLGMLPHPEGGHYVETFRDTAVDASGRAASSSIYFLLASGEVSRWHRVDAVEIWHWYAGAALLLSTRTDGQQADLHLGPDLLSGARPQRIVLAGQWQSARSLGDWTLVGCTVAPAFSFDGFALAPGNGLPSD